MSPGFRARRARGARRGRRAGRRAAAARAAEVEARDAGGDGGPGLVHGGRVFRGLGVVETHPTARIALRGRVETGGGLYPRLRLRVGRFPRHRRGRRLPEPRRRSRLIHRRGGAHERVHARGVAFGGLRVARLPFGRHRRARAPAGLAPVEHLVEMHVILGVRGADAPRAAQSHHLRRLFEQITPPAGNTRRVRVAPRVPPCATRAFFLSSPQDTVLAPSEPRLVQHGPRPCACARRSGPRARRKSLSKSTKRKARRVHNIRREIRFARTRPQTRRISSLPARNSQNEKRGVCFFTDVKRSLVTRRRARARLRDSLLTRHHVLRRERRTTVVRHVF